MITQYDILCHCIANDHKNNEHANNTALDTRRETDSVCVCMEEARQGVCVCECVCVCVCVCVREREGERERERVH